MKREHTHYRYESKTSKYATRWRVIPKEGVLPPTKPTAKKLGDGYSLMLRNKAKKR